ncbi:GntR family transcriptional regulator [Evansella halocellulosilytica]|uniref:GntR family transcriptional regulator n=1 Tax=Evansella halocellulosilytica TaxID=2011013 RepID=UPI000BB86C9A|nr:GntR family transcriptional regulator [Evansella halocellulosilytica]
MINENQRQNTSTLAYEKIRNKIIELELEPGEHIIEVKLSEELNISRTPLRQALNQLQLEGLVMKGTNGRIYVAELDVKDIIEVFHVREVLEGLIIREATNHVTDDDIEQMDHFIQLMKMTAAEKKYDKTVFYGSQFHHRLYGPSGCQTAVRFLEQIKGHIERFRRIPGYRQPDYNVDRVVKEHEELLFLIKQNKPEEAEASMKKHIQRSLKTTLEVINTHCRLK